MHLPWRPAPPHPLTHLPSHLTPTPLSPLPPAANLSVNLGLPRAIAVDAPALPWFDTAPHPAHVSVRAIAGDHPTIDDLTAFGFRTSLSHRRHEMRSRGLDTLLGLHEMIAYGIKGICAYAHHADNLGYRSQTVDLFIWKAMGFLASSASQDVDKVLAMAMELGAVNLETMALLDRASTETYGTPVPTAVRITPRKGKCIVVSGHDLRDLEQLLQQTEGMGIIGEGRGGGGGVVRGGVWGGVGVMVCMGW